MDEHWNWMRKNDPNTWAWLLPREVAEDRHCEARAGGRHIVHNQVLAGVTCKNAKVCSDLERRAVMMRNGTRLTGTLGQYRNGSAVPFPDSGTWEYERTSENA